jgi:hypothetical protein
VTVENEEMKIRSHILSKIKKKKNYIHKTLYKLFLIDCMNFFLKMYKGLIKRSVVVLFLCNELKTTEDNRLKMIILQLFYI